MHLVQAPDKLLVRRGRFGCQGEVSDALGPHLPWA